MRLLLSIREETVTQKGYVKPLMPSELVALAQTELARHGDMIVWCETLGVGYDDNEETSGPVLLEPGMELVREPVNLRMIVEVCRKSIATPLAQAAIREREGEL